MKRLIGILLIVPLLTSCMVLRISTIKADGKNIGGTYAMATGNAKRMDLIGIGYTVLTTERMSEKILSDLPKVLIQVDKDNQIKEVKIETNFEAKNK